ncbi:MAG: glycosyltransferase family 1 protein [Pseudomonadota bacterium]
MRIGLDLLLEPTVITGTGIHALGVVRGLASIDKTNEYFLFVHCDNLPAFYQPQDNFHCLGYKFNAVSDVHRHVAQLLLLRRITGAPSGSRLDLLHSLTNVAPPLYSGRSVVTVHDLAPLTLPKNQLTALQRLWWPALVRRSVAKARRVIAVSERTKADLMQHLSTPADAVTVITNGVDGGFMPQAAGGGLALLQGLAPGREYVLYVGRLAASKNLTRLVGAYGRLPESARQRFQLLLVGPDEGEEAGLREQVARLGLGDAVLFSGYVPHERLPAYYRQARCLVLASHYEGFGLPLAEAMACGTPVVAANTGSMPEVVGQGGLLVDPTDEAALAQAIERLCLNDRLHGQLGAAALAQAARYSWEKAARRTLAVYKATE